MSGSLQSLCLQLTTISQTMQRDNQLCRYFFTQLSTLFDPCSTKIVRTARSVTVSCNYTSWHTLGASSSDVSTCSEQDKQQFIHSVCGDKTLLNQLTIQTTDNNWLQGFCAYNTNPDNMCQYVSWDASTISDFSVAYCWLYDQDQFTLYLCEDPDFLYKLKGNPNNEWLDPVCPTEAPTDTATLSMIQQLCNYDQWQIENIDPSLVAFCAWNDQTALANYVCLSLEVPQQLFIYEFNPWIAEICHNFTTGSSENTCNYLAWLKKDNNNQSTLAVSSSLVSNCSQIDENQFLSSVCKNSTLLITLTRDTNNIWVLPFCSQHLCNYTTWNSSVDAESVDFCWQFDPKQLELFLCSNQSTTKQIKVYKSSNLTCNGNTTNATLCNYNFSNLTALNSSILATCATKDAQHFSQFICENFTLVTQLSKSSEYSWIPSFCNEKLNYSIANCTQYIVNFLSSSCQNSTDLNKFTVWNFCNYSSWTVVNPTAFFDSYCRYFDNMTFSQVLCNRSELYDKLIQFTASGEIIPKCHSAEICPGSTWNLTSLQDFLIQYCFQWDTQNFTQYCSNSSFNKLLDEMKNLSWVKSYCGNSSLLSDGLNHCASMNWIQSFCNGTLGPWWSQNYNCEYGNWENNPPNSDNVLLCWVVDRDNFTAHVCAQANLLSNMANDSATSWVVNFCSSSNTTNESTACLSDDDKKKLQWNCTADLSSVCPREGLTLSSFLPLSACYLQSTGVTPAANITEHYVQAVDTTVILLLLLEEMQILSLSGSDMIRAKVWNSAMDFFSQKGWYSEQRRELVLKFGNTLLILAEEHISSNRTWILIEELFQLALPDLKAVITSLQPEAVKTFLNILYQNWTSLQVSEEYFSMIITTLLTVQVTSTPLLFTDIIPFIRFLEPDEIIRLLPPLQDDKEVLQVLAVYAGSLSEEQRFALGFWLRRSIILRNISQLDDLFIQKVGNMLPLLPLDVFKQLSAQQVVNILPVIPEDLSPPYQRTVVSRMLQVANITVQDVELMGYCVCQADVQVLEHYQQKTDIFMALKRNLFQCVKSGELFPNSQMLDFLTADLHWQDPQTLSPQTISNLSTVIPALSYTFLQALTPEQFLPALADIGSARLTPVQARVLVEKILNIGNISDEMLPNIGSLVLGFSPMFLQELSAKQLIKLLPALTNHSSSLSYAQTLAVIRTLWTSWNVTHRLQELGPLLNSLPLIHLCTRSNEILSNLNNWGDVKWNQQQALFLFRKVTQTIQVGVRSSMNTVIGNTCDLLKKILQDDIQIMTQLYGIINSLPRQLIRCALDEINTLPLILSLLNHLSSRNLLEIHPGMVSLLPLKSCRSLMKTLKSEAQFVSELPQQRRFAILDALLQCLSSARTMSTTEKFVALGILTPFLRGSSYQLLSYAIMRQSVERVTGYCYPQETRLLLGQLLQSAKGFRSSTLWTSSLLERLDRLVPLLPISTLQSLNTEALSSIWAMQILSEERKWRETPLGVACRQSESAAESLDSMQRQRTLLKRSSLIRLQLKTSVSAPECSMLHDSIVSAWGVHLILGMTPTDFMDCLEIIGQDPDIPTSELGLLLSRVLEIAGPPSELPSLVLVRLGRLATQFSEKQLKEISLNDWQVMNAFGKQKEWTTNQLTILATGYMNSNSLIAQTLDSLQLATLGYAVCGLPEEDMRQINANEFCLAVMYLGQLALRCTEHQLSALKQLCANSGMFGPVSGWTEEVFREIGSVAAGLDDMELSALVLEQIHGLTPLAVSLIQPTKFAVAFSVQQLKMFSWLQAKAVTDQQRKLLDMEQLKALTLALNEDSGNQTYKAGKSHASHCSLCALLHLCVLIPALHIYNLLRPITVHVLTHSVESDTIGVYHIN
ncbi:stereocilin-like [Pyxicephalus adspersus]|uniref:stereocilin-like n=1 Tax=Pyxicephalus adspersus TaxID=30357 RepID=UPI003B59CA39